MCVISVKNICIWTKLLHVCVVFLRLDCEFVWQKLAVSKLMSKASTKNSEQRLLRQQWWKRIEEIYTKRNILKSFVLPVKFPSLEEGKCFSIFSDERLKSSKNWEFFSSLWGIFFERKESVGNEVRSPIFDSLSTEGTFLNLEKREETWIWKCKKILGSIEKLIALAILSVMNTHFSLESENVKRFSVPSKSL